MPMNVMLDRVVNLGLKLQCSYVRGRCHVQCFEERTSLSEIRPGAGPKFCSGFRKLYRPLRDS